jgi:tRNA pseudouridine13 synthase
MSIAKLEDFIPSLEKYIGIGTYLTETPPAGGRIKLDPFDFYVEEILEGLNPKKNGRFTVIKLLKINWDTAKLARYITRILGISSKEIKYAGIKDKKAATVQHFLITKRIEPDQVRLLEEKLQDVKILDYFYTDDDLWIGKLKGNKFKIIISEISNINNFVSAAKEVSKKGFLNFYGFQRFGLIRPNTHLVGRLLLQEAYEAAFYEQVCRWYPGEQELTVRFRQLAASGNLEEFLREAPSWLYVEKLLVKNFLRYRDYRKSFKKLPYDIKSLFFHAYQSYLFNRALSLYAKFYKIPRFIVISVQDPIIRHILREENINLRNAKKLGVKLKPISRESIVFPKAFKYKVLSNTKAELEFELPRGCYATSLVREICKGQYW